ncbi:hypothetical protein NQ176_g2796 [Zarea fungicola]|uniref:Uncharacterized protein n=1 Tax=Zarea fungicola TaxID=93591 RepID=A0ACC1NNT0_9HYPO|nr:hypothetical protein NQ176_g2796 [Lecanicillium fungicola]
MSSKITVLITGANRGIGKGLTEAFLSRASTTVIAAVRDPSQQTSLALVGLPKGVDSKLILVKLDASIESDAANAVSQLRKEHNIEALDIVIANAGIGIGGSAVRDTTAASILEHVKINTIAPVLLFQATAGILRASKTGNPKFIAISTVIGSIAKIDQVSPPKFPENTSPYGASKTALNWFIRRLHFEEPWLTSFVIHPGLVDTDLSAGVFAGTGKDPKDFGAISVDTSVAGLIKAIDAANRDIGGTFQNYDGAVNPW